MKPPNLSLCRNFTTYLNSFERKFKMKDRIASKQNSRNVVERASNCVKRLGVRLSLGAVINLQLETLENFMPSANWTLLCPGTDTLRRQHDADMTTGVIEVKASGTNPFVAAFDQDRAAQSLARRTRRLTRCGAHRVMRPTGKCFLTRISRIFTNSISMQFMSEISRLGLEMGGCCRQPA